MKKIMKIVQSSYLHLSNILLSWIKFSSRVIESSFSTWFEFLSSTSQLNLTLFQKNFNLTWLDAISLFWSSFEHLNTNDLNWN